MKKNYFNLRLRSQWLLIALLALLTGASPAWATDPVTENFNGTLPTGWSIEGSLTKGSDRARSGDGIYTYNSSNNNYLVTEAVEGTFEFYARAYNKNSNSYVEIYEYTGSGLGTKLYSTSNMRTSSTPTWAKYSTTISSASQLAIVLLYAAIDDVTYTPGVVSPYKKPASLSFNNITVNAADAVWTAAETSETLTGWNLEYKKSSEANYTAINNIAASTTTLTLSGLSDNTTYDVRVAAVYNTNISNWCTGSFTTLMAPISSFPWTESFNSLTTANTIPDGWDNSEGTTTNNSYKWCYNTSTSGNGATNGTGHDGKCIRFESYNNSSNNTNFLKTPKLDFTAGNPMQLVFWYKNPKGGDFSVYISDDGGATYTTELATGLTGASAWTEKEIAIPSAFIGKSNVVIVFKGTSNYATGDANIYLDDVTVEEASACPKPTDLTASTPTWQGATLSWTAGSDETEWKVIWGAAGFDPTSTDPSVAHVIDNVTENPYTLTGLSPETEYDVYVQAVKGSNVSVVSNKANFTTLEQYPKPTAVSVSPADVSATFQWTVGRDETAWQIKYSTDENFDPASEGTLQAVTTNPYTLTGLTVGETYYAYLRADYGESHYSLWSDKLTFTTAVEHELTVNEGNGSTTSGSVPFYGSYADEAIRGSSQFIIPASQLGSMNGRNINKITFYTTENIAWKSGGNPTFKVYLKEVNNEKFGSKTFIDWATMTEIYDGEIAFDGKQLIISLATPFNYSGGNLMVGFYETVAGGWCATSWVGTSADDEVGVQNASGATSYNWAAFLPKTTFYYETLTGPRLAVSTDALDFGELNQSSTAEDKQKTFTISNTGVQELTGLSVAVSGTGYSVSALPRTNITTAGAESAPIELTVTLNPSESGSYPGTVTISAAGQPNKVINLTASYVGGPMFGVFNNELATEAATTGQTVNFGYAQEAPTYTYYIKNTGVGTLDVAVNKGGLTVSPASASLAAGEQQAFTITADVANADATVTFTGTNHDGGAEVGTFNVTLQGTVMPLTATFFESFNYANGNATTTELAGWEINNNTYNVKFNSGKLCYDASSTEAGNVITPKLRVSGTSDVLRINASITNKSWSNTKVAISYSADKVNWTELTNKGKNDFTTAGVLQAFELNGIPEGSYYFKIELSDAAVDYFYGFSTTLPDAETIAENVAPAFTTGVKDINLKHSFVAGWNTVCLPFTINATDIHANAKALEFSAYNDVTKELTFAPVTELTASKPYVIYVPDAIAT